MSSTPTLETQHDSPAGRFAAQVAGGRAECAYRVQGSLMNIVHTEVPVQSEGRGVAAALVEATLAHARRMGWTVWPSCSRVRGYMQRHPETRNLLPAR